jgi:hypothetical protein
MRGIRQFSINPGINGTVALWTMVQRAIWPKGLLDIMPKDTRDKVTLIPEAYKALEVEAMLMGVSLKEAASRMILKSACPKCKEILGIMTRSPNGQKEEGTKGPLAQGLNDPAAQVIIDPSMDNVAKGQRDQEPKDPLIDNETKGTRAKGHKSPKGQSPEGKSAQRAKKKSLAKDAEALAKIKELWASGAYIPHF